MINTVIINAQSHDRDIVETFLAPQEDIKILAYGKDGYDALKFTGSIRPDIIILDNQLEFIEGGEIPPLLKIRSPSTAIVILTDKISDMDLCRAASNKVEGIVNKETELEILPKILKCVSRGGCFISPFFAARVLDHFSAMSREQLLSSVSVKKPRVRIVRKPQPEPKFPPEKDPAGFLSKMELKTLTCIGEGHTSGQIAENLGLAVGTVRNNISSVMRKTGLRNRSQMARYALYYGLVPLRLPQAVRAF